MNYTIKATLKVILSGVLIGTGMSIFGDALSEFSINQHDEYLKIWAKNFGKIAKDFDDGRVVIHFEEK